MVNEVKIAMIRAGVTQASICSALHVHPSTVSLVVSRKKTSRRIQAAIALAVGIPVAKLFPKHNKEAA